MRRRSDAPNLVKYGQVWLNRGDAVDDAELLRRIALAADQQTLPDVAQQFWERLLSLEPHDGEALQRVVTVVHKAGDTIRAIELFERLAASELPLGQRREAREFQASACRGRAISDAIAAFRHLAELENRHTDALIRNLNSPYNSAAMMKRLRH